MNNWCICWFLMYILLGILIFKWLNARRFYKPFGVKGLNLVVHKVSLRLYKFNAVMAGFSLLDTTATLGRDNSVGMAPRYGLDGPGTECRCGREIPHLFRLALGPTQPPIHWVPGLSWGKAAEAWH
jgi:hypothetical protein